MGIFDRLAKLTQAKVNEALDNVEDPIEMCDQHIRDMQERYSQAELASAPVIGNARAIQKEIDEAQQELQDWDDKIRLAVSKDNDELARKAIVKKSEVAQKITSLQSSYTAAHVQAEKLKDTLKELKEEIDTTRRKRDELEARYKTAEASTEVNQILVNVTTKPGDLNMDDLERKVSHKEAMANGMGEIASLKHDNLDDEFKALGSSVDVDAELAKYKK